MSLAKRQTSRIADWLLLPRDLEAPQSPPLSPARRGGAWQPIFSGGDFVLYTSAPNGIFVGAPWREISIDGPPGPGGSAVSGGRAWLLGESPESDQTLIQITNEVARGGDPSRLGGRFLLLVFDAEKQCFEVITDRHGSLHAYATADGRAASTCFAALTALAGQSQLDWLGLASFFAYGFFLGERTFKTGIRCLAPARRHRLGAGIDSRRYWQWSHEVDVKRSHAETLDVFAGLFERVVEEAATAGDNSGGPNSGSPVALPLSGGLDSRALLAAWPQDARSPWCFGYGYQEDSIEIRIARQLASRRGLPFEAFVIEPYLATHLGTALALVEGFQDLTQTRQLAIAAPLREHASAVLAGHWGDVWLDDMGLAGHPSASDTEVLSHTLGRLRKRGRAWLLDKLARPHLDEDPEKLLGSEVAETLGDYAHLEDADFRVKAFKTDHWSWRFTLASVRAYQAAAFPRLPFYDPRLVDFFTTVPTASVAGRRLELDYLRQRAPDLARVPWQETGASLFQSRRQAWWLGLPRRAAARALRTIRRQPVIERNWQIQLLGPEGRHLLDATLLRPGLRLHDLVAESEVRALVTAFQQHPTAESGYTVSMLLTFAAWLEHA